MSEYFVWGRSRTTPHHSLRFQEAREVALALGREGRGEGLAMDSQHRRRRRIMKRAMTSVVFVLSFVSLLVLGLVSRAQAEDCSNAKVKGGYGFSCEGTVGGLPIAVVGVFTADGNGNGAETLSAN